MVRRSFAAGLTALCLAVLGVPATAAEVAWVKDELRINLRSGPGVQFRIMGRLKTGDRVEVLQQGDGWTQIRVPEKGDGWIPEGYLQGTPPAGMRLAKSEAQTADFRQQLDDLTAQVESLGQENEALAERDGAQRAEIDRLGDENRELKAGARWPEWITGAGILSAGMILGAILRSASGRRGRKIRL
jgi:SH3 domain protein